MVAAGCLCLVVVGQRRVRAAWAGRGVLCEVGRFSLCSACSSRLTVVQILKCTGSWAYGGVRPYTL